MTLDEIYAKQDWWQRRYDRAHERRDQAERTAYLAAKHMGITVLVEQIAAALQPYFEATLEVLGPFGLTNETSIHARLDGKTVGSLSFRPRSVLGDYRLCLVDRGHVTQEFPAGSLGAMNGMNYAEVELPSDIEGLAALLVVSIDEGMAREREKKVCRRLGHAWQPTEADNIMACPQCGTGRTTAVDGTITYHYAREYLYGTRH